MKVSKSLLQAIAVGITLGAASSCSILEDKIEIITQANCDDTCEQTCEGDHENKNGHNVWDCPACGMG